MTDKKFEPYWTKQDEGCFEFLGKIGNRNLVCRICGAKFEKDIDENNGFVLLDSSDLEDHYKSTHSDFIQRNNLEFYTGQRIPCTTEMPLYDNPHIIVVHESTHKPPATEQEPYFHVYIMRPKKRKEELKTPLAKLQKSSWVTIYRNVGEDKIGECLLKQMESLEKAGWNLRDNVRLAIFKNKSGNWTISTRTHLEGMEDDEHIFSGNVDGEECVE